MPRPSLHPLALDRAVLAVEKVRERLLRAAAALEKAGVPYAVIGGNAVAVWVASVDPSAVRNTSDVDVLIRRGDLSAARAALEAAGFVYRRADGIVLFLDGPAAKARDAVHVLFANEKGRPEYALPAPDVGESEAIASYRVLALDALVRMKLTSFRDTDRTHLRDFLDVGLIDAAWTKRLPPDLAARLQLLIDTPEG
jgi:hypothetical protein